MSKEHGTVLGDVMPIEVCAEPEKWARGISIYMRRVTVGVSVDIAEPIKFRTLSAEDAEMAMATEPAMRLDLRSAQQLMDELWHCGLRPTEGTGSAGSLAATQRHLEDMRRLVFEGAAKP